MLVSEYDAFVQRTDQSASYPPTARYEVAVHGLAGEVGSVAAAIKKRLLAGEDSDTWNQADPALVEELGDVMWYCFSLARAANPTTPVNIFAHDIANLRREIAAGDARAERIARALEPTKLEEFLKAAEAFPKRSRNMEFEHYQDLAFLTARTHGHILAGVCLAVLWQLSAELLRKTLPDVELEINRSLPNRPVNDLLGEVAWHVAALASLFHVRLSDIARANIQKVSQRWDRQTVTPLHDEDRPATEQFPRQFSVAFVQIGPRRSRMYLDGRSRLGDDLTDNSYDEDGYRYHDVMHLANAAKLGWSPVLRKLLGRKRKLDPELDEIEDGARAQIVEEAVIKAIHSEGERLAIPAPAGQGGEPLRLFASSADISFGFLKFVTRFVADLEVERNRYWEWEAAILEGYEVFYQLRCAGQGTVAVDLTTRSLSFSPEVFLDIPGRITGLGSAFGNLRADHWEVTKEAILNALGLTPSDALKRELDVAVQPQSGLLSVRSTGGVREAMWARGAITFRTARADHPTGFFVTAAAITDD